jgi:hypothetical protein
MGQVTSGGLTALTLGFDPARFPAEPPACYWRATGNTELGIQPVDRG